MNVEVEAIPEIRALTEQLNAYTEEQVPSDGGQSSIVGVKHKIKNEVGFPIEFHKRKFLFDIYNDLSPLQVVLKPPQIGATVMNTLKTFWVAKKLKRQIIYTLPPFGYSRYGRWFIQPYYRAESYFYGLGKRPRYR